MHNKKHGNDLFLNAFQYAPSGIALVSLDGNWLMVNPSFCRLLGYEEKELLTKTFQDITFPADLEMDLDNVQSMLKSEMESYQIEKRYIHKQGHLVWALLSVSLVHNEDGTPKYFISQILDISAIKQAEEKLVQSEQWFRLLADYSTDMISRHSPEGLYRYVSPVCFNLLGYKPEELLDTMAYDYYHPDDIAMIRSNHSEITKKQDIQTLSYRIRKKDGTYTWFETTGRAIMNTANQITEIIAVSRDITKRKTSEIQMNEANELLLKLSMTDGLTGIANRRAFDETLEREWKINARLGQPFSLLLCDLDFFKAFNDTYGHQAGDICLQKVAQTLKEALYRPNDFVARYGGEEFAIILPNTNEQGAMQVSNAIQARIKDLHIPHHSSKLSDSDVVTLSIGLVTIIPTPLLNAYDLVDHADKALYQAKSSGRNRVATYQ